MSRGGVEIARLPHAPGRVGAVAAAEDLVYVGVGGRLVALDRAGVRWQVELGASDPRPMVLELRVVDGLLLVRTLHPMNHFAPVWAFDRYTGDVVDGIDLWNAN